MANSGQDPVIAAYRGQIAALDRKLLEALNGRLELVARLKAHKEAQGLPFQDAEQEERVLEALRQANPGPLSQAGLEAFFRLVLDLAKREAFRKG